MTLPAKVCTHVHVDLQQLVFYQVLYHPLYLIFSMVLLINMVIYHVFKLILTCSQHTLSGAQFDISSGTLSNTLFGTFSGIPYVKICVIILWKRFQCNRVHKAQSLWNSKDSVLTNDGFV